MLVTTQSLPYLDDAESDWDPSRWMWIPLESSSGKTFHLREFLNCILRIEKNGGKGKGYSNSHQTFQAVLCRSFGKGLNPCLRIHTFWRFKLWLPSIFQVHLRKFIPKLLLLGTFVSAITFLAHKHVGIQASPLLFQVLQKSLSSQWMISPKW